ncbi:DUF5662 family protein [[Clostridium] innocuum]|uniref:DUF5662 family protein n=1 Tax=Clostridium innocuum TaxID=1522 RepID=UPI001AF86610|nr:DUF5662 family protein [[Clostridium] innocuum]QSI27809.1 hypothetical protein GKZ87_21030 [Erysipelotrichaceae bacterium 66202529]DAU14244.1 MAG TPA: hypothetical protein [Caudoviricetes sp.]MCC2832080.1 DUF5662 family protein [[Clostridium] innocuum]MCR0247006.1 DUF5662 family protein [[Clostridium] innocuum]MCR0258368.1 DUF5662 family protein [[Clostridium] innocuum]
MSKEYDDYLNTHKANVKKGFEWIKNNLPEIITDDGITHQTCFSHDFSKTEPDEYEAYDKYFYGGNRSYQVVRDFKLAWLKHIHRNPHHWQYWILNNDDPDEGELVLDIPYNYIIEMICDWWSFSWAVGNLTEIFNWYDERKEYIKLSDETRTTVENILCKIESKLKEVMTNE